MATYVDCPGPTPGPKGVIKQHKVMASGYELPSTPRRVDVFQRETKTGETDAPGFTSRGGKGKR